MAKQNISVSGADTLKWDLFVAQKATEALPKIYEHAMAFSQATRDWYWKSIKPKRICSVIARAISYALAAGGIASPLIAAIFEQPAVRLVFAESGVAAVAIAAAVMLCDTVFGWSSGWLRYVATATTVERLTRQFQLEWASYFSTSNGLTEADKKPLFDLAKTFASEIENQLKLE